MVDFGNGPLTYVDVSQLCAHAFGIGSRNGFVEVLRWSLALRGSGEPDSERQIRYRTYLIVN